MKRLSIYWIFMALLVVSCKDKDKGEWDVYGGSKERIQYSALDLIDTSNVDQLKVAWTYHTRDGEASSGQIQANPLIVDGVLYGVSPKLKLFAADAATGQEKWQFDPVPMMEIDNQNRQSYGMNACRGIALLKEKNGEHLLYYTVGSSLFCVNSKTGQIVSTFGKEGRVPLHDGLEMGRDITNLRVTSTSPGVIYKDLIILGTSLSESEESAPGNIRAYDVRTGEMKWMFRTIPQPGEIGYDSWEDPEAYKFVGGANAWGGLSVDEERGMVFASTGSAVPDFYGGKRKGDNLFSNSVLALDAATGTYKWHFQGVHHDLWDYDFPTAPVLVTIKKDGRKVDAVVQVSKQGFIYMLDRETGKPVHPIVEKPFPASDLAGEQTSPTQPVPTVLPPFARQEFNESDLNDLVSKSSYEELKKRFLKYKRGGMFIPPSLEGSMVFPGYTGGAEWGGPSFDPSSGILYINATEMPWIGTMIDTLKEKLPVSAQTNLEAGKSIYLKSCRGCHGADLKGAGSFPSLVDLKKKYNEIQFKDIITSGVRMMPAFKQFSEQERTALASYLLDIKSKQGGSFKPVAKEVKPFYRSPYRFAGYKQFLTVEGYPGIKPPWGTLSAIDLSTGKLVWRNPLGDYPELKAKGIHAGTENWGGSVVTAGGVVFIAATRDEKFRAFNKTTGKLLFETDLPAAGYATPAVYSVDGKQYVVIACGGGRMKTKSGDTYVAFSLPDKVK
ncbi:MAG: PQQ-binding-like beta-propeller repeat protein [Daejeonella sp.]|uniref:outer membrane protein assembly factor BamB family protein n=1 Tax=Daejeonella sp. JGW-45 TaxID=3034148 RepID=UPI0023EACA78|nr:PQQ-binding-like beta-propeller repeat protein [Daejeonella sp. JGW-45]